MADYLDMKWRTFYNGSEQSRAKQSRPRASGAPRTANVFWVLMLVFRGCGQQGDHHLRWHSDVMRDDMLIVFIVF